jgi:hypothetical protein
MSISSSFSEEQYVCQMRSYVPEWFRQRLITEKMTWNGEQVASRRVPWRHAIYGGSVI